MTSMSIGRTIRLLTILFSAGLATASCGGSAEPISLTGPLAADVAGVAAESPRAGAQAAATQLRFSVDLTVPAYPVCPLTPPDAGIITGTGLSRRPRPVSGCASSDSTSRRSSTSPAQAASRKASRSASVRSRAA